METIRTALRPDGDAEVHEEFVNQMKVRSVLDAWSVKASGFLGALSIKIVIISSIVYKKPKRYW